jgi:ribonuclease HIII
MKKIGVDESGKGDYFGYLVVAGVLVNEERESKLRELGVKDSKKLSDIVILKMAPEIKKHCRCEIIKISPEKYNQLHLKFKNLNKLLAWGHARVIENLLEKEDADMIIVDKFADEKVLKGMLFDLAKKKKVIQRINGEQDTAVAAASVLARAEFLKTLRALSLQVGYKLPKGATHVEEAAREILKKYDENILDVIAKKHFKTTKKLISKNDK